MNRQPAIGNRQFSQRLLTSSPTREKVDPENKLVRRMNPGRMEAEAVRDSILHLAGAMDPRMGGQELENKDALTTVRRSLYYSFNPESDGRSEFSALFDAPDANECYRRTRSVIPQQALALTNSKLVHDRTAALVKRLGATAKGGTGDPPVPHGDPPGGTGVSVKAKGTTSGRGDRKSVV